MRDHEGMLFIVARLTIFFPLAMCLSKFIIKYFSDDFFLPEQYFNTPQILNLYVVCIHTFSNDEMEKNERKKKCIRNNQSKTSFFHHSNNIFFCF